MSRKLTLSARSSSTQLRSCLRSCSTVSRPAQTLGSVQQPPCRSQYSSLPAERELFWQFHCGGGHSDVEFQIVLSQVCQCYIDRIACRIVDDAHAAL